MLGLCFYGLPKHVRSLEIWPSDWGRGEQVGGRGTVALSKMKGRGGQIRHVCGSSSLAVS